MTSKLFCPMCISSGGSTSGSRKRRKGHRSSVDSVGSDNEDDNFYRPSKEALKSKTSSISTSDPDQPFHVPSIFKPIRVDSPALFVRGSNSTVSEQSRVFGGKNETGELQDIAASSSEEEIGYRSKAIGTSDDNNIGLSRQDEKGEKIKMLEECDDDDDDSNEYDPDDDNRKGTCSHKQVQDEQQQSRENDKKSGEAAAAVAGAESLEEQGEKRSCKDRSNKTDDISKSVGASSSPRTKKSLGKPHGSPTIVNIARARPRAGSDFKKKLNQHGLPKSEFEDGTDDSILNPDDPGSHPHHYEEHQNDDKERNQQECCAYSYDSQSSRSLSVNYDSHCPDLEARQPLLLAASELDLVSDDEENEDCIMEENEDEQEEENERQQGFVPNTHATFQQIDNSSQEEMGERETKSADKSDLILEKEEKKIVQVSQGKIVIPQIVTDSSIDSTGVSRDNMDLHHLQARNLPSSENSSKSSTPAPPSLPDCPPPDSESDCWSRSGSNTRCPSRSCGGSCHCYYYYRNSSNRNKRQSCSCGTSPVRDQQQIYYDGHTQTTGNRADGGSGPPCSENFECKGALSLVDMSQIHYADSASSCCGSDICDMGDGDNTITRTAVATLKSNNNRVVHTSTHHASVTSPVIAQNSSETTIATVVVTDNNNDNDPYGKNDSRSSYDSHVGAAAARVDDNNDVIGNVNRNTDAGQDSSQNFSYTTASTYCHVENDDRAANQQQPTIVRYGSAYRPIKKVSASVNTDIVMPSHEIYAADKDNDENIEAMIMSLDRSDSQEELRSASTTPTPEKYVGDDDDSNVGGEEIRECRLLSTSSLPPSASPSQAFQEEGDRSPSAITTTGKAKGIRSSSVTITLMRTPRETHTEDDMKMPTARSEENKELVESDPNLWRSTAERKSTPESIPTMITYTLRNRRTNENRGNDNQLETRILAEGFYYSEMDLDLALQNKHTQASGKWHYPYHSTGHVPTADDPRTPLVLVGEVEGGEESVEEYEEPVLGLGQEEGEDEDEITIEDLRPLIAAATTTKSVNEDDGADQSPQVHYRGVRTNVTGSWFSLSSSSSLEDYDEKELIMASSSDRDIAAAAIVAATTANTTAFDPERFSPESSPSLSILSYEEILTEQQRIQQDVQRVVDAVKKQNFDKSDDTEELGDGSKHDGQLLSCLVCNRHDFHCMHCRHDCRRCE